MLERTEHRGYVIVAAATVAALSADQLARRVPVIAGNTLFFTADGGSYERAIWEPDPQLLTLRDGMWLLAVIVVFWLIARAVTGSRATHARRRWISIPAWTGLGAGLVVGVLAYWLERPRTLMAGEVGLRAVTDEVHTVLGPLGDITGRLIAVGGHDAWLVTAPAVTWGLYGAFAGVTMVIVRALLPEQPNGR